MKLSISAIAAPRVVLLSVRFLPLARELDREFFLDMHRRVTSAGLVLPHSSGRVRKAFLRRDSFCVTSQSMGLPARAGGPIALLCVSCVFLGSCSSSVSCRRFRCWRPPRRRLGHVGCWQRCAVCAGFVVSCQSSFDGWTSRWAATSAMLGVVAGSRS